MILAAEEVLVPIGSVGLEVEMTLISGTGVVGVLAILIQRNYFIDVDLRAVGSEILSDEFSGLLVYSLAVEDGVRLLVVVPDAGSKCKGSCKESDILSVLFISQ